jgi:hypothetical protein
MGGTDDPSNIEKLTPSEHAEAHRKLYEKHGKIEDYLAWKGLEGFIGKEDIIKSLMTENGKKLGRRMLEEGRGIFDPAKKETEKYKEGISRGGKVVGRMMAESGHCKKIAPTGGLKNIGKKFWYNTETGEETIKFDKPDEGWAHGRNMNNINVDFLRENSDNAKGSFWAVKKETGETRMIHGEENIPEGFQKGRIFKTENILDLVNCPEDCDFEGVEKINESTSYISFNRGSFRWEFAPRKKGKKIIKVSHTDYYGLVWFKDCFAYFKEVNYKKSEKNFYYDSLEKCLKVLEGWRKYRLYKKILEKKKIKKSRREFYISKAKNYEDLYNFLEEKIEIIRNY